MILNQCLNWLVSYIIRPRSRPSSWTRGQMRSARAVAWHEPADRSCAAALSMCIDSGVSKCCTHVNHCLLTCVDTWLFRQSRGIESDRWRVQAAPAWLAHSSDPFRYRSISRVGPDRPGRTSGLSFHFGDRLLLLLVSAVYYGPALFWFHLLGLIETTSQ